MARAYVPRIVDTAVERALAAAGAIVLEGPRATGKTATAMHAAASHVLLDDPAAQQMLELAPERLLDGARPRLLDEWQVAPELWNMVRRTVDAIGEPGQFILTGSALPADDVTRHTGAGRFVRIRQRTMTWSEQWPEPDPVRLSELFDGAAPGSDPSHLDLRTVVDRIAASGFPGLLERSIEERAIVLDAYLDEIARADVARLSPIRHEPAMIRALIAAIARNSASEVSFATLRRDLLPTAPSIDVETVAAYVALLERLYIVERQAAWSPQLRSRARLRTSPKLHLADPGLALVAMGGSASWLLDDPETVGLLFESQVHHDVAAMVAPLGGEVRHLRDSNGREADAIVVLPDGRWGAIEVKVSGRQIGAATTSLATATAQIDTTVVGEPVFRLVVTGTGGTFRLDDGTVTVPLHRIAT